MYVQHSRRNALCKIFNFYCVRTWQYHNHIFGYSFFDMHSFPKKPLLPFYTPFIIVCVMYCIMYIVCLVTYPVPFLIRTIFYLFRSQQ